MPTRGACPGRAQPPAACARSTADAPRRPRAWSWPARRLFFPPLPICPSPIAPMALTHLIFQLIRCRRFAASAPPLALDRGLRAWAGGGEVRGGAGRGWRGPAPLSGGEPGGGGGAWSCAHPTCPNRLELSPGCMGWSWNHQNHPERPLWPREIISRRLRDRAPVGASNRHGPEEGQY
jgi:hypothetical protein